MKAKNLMKKQKRNRKRLTFQIIFQWLELILFGGGDGKKSNKVLQTLHHQKP